jgi:hypothetical protein
MDRRQFTTMANKFQSVLDEEVFNEHGQTLGLRKRQRLITPFRLGLSVMGSMATWQVQTIADLYRQFNELGNLIPIARPSISSCSKRLHPNSSWTRSVTSGVNCQ